MIAKESTQALSILLKTITSANASEQHSRTNAVAKKINFAEHFLTILNDGDSIASQHPSLAAMALETISRA